MPTIGELKVYVSRLTNRGRRPNDVLEHEWSEAEALWQDRKAVTTLTLNPVSAARIDNYFYDADGKRRSATGWAEVNEAERMLARELTPSQLCAQYHLLLDLATDRNLVGLANYPNMADYATKSDDDKRNIYATLLYTLQSAFINARYIRHLRSEVSGTIFRHGLFLLLLALAVPLFWLRESWLQVEHAVHPDGAVGPLYIDETIFGLCAVAISGALGAFFSRAMRFQADLPTLNFDTVIQNYVAKMLRLRILYGMIGAIIFYFVMRGAFVGGNLFPTLAAGMISDQTVWKLDIVAHPVAVAHAAKAVGLATATTILAPAEQLAKLLVWSFLAGFSERLVPDTLSRLEKKSNDAAGKAS